MKGREWDRKKHNKSAHRRPGTKKCETESHTGIEWYDYWTDIDIEQNKP